MDPLTRGDYPESMRSLVKSRLPKFTKEQSRLLINSFDFLGINYYTANYVSDAPELRNVRGNYITDSLVNFSCKQACLITYIFIYVYMLNLRYIIYVLNLIFVTCLLFLLLQLCVTENPLVKM